MNTLAEKAQLRAETAHDPRWVDVVAGNTGSDGKFYYAVKTTGVYCRPSCAARAARPENVSFYETREAAENAGFRPCKRCQPDRPVLVEQYANVTKACQSIEGIIEKSETVPSLKDLAKQVGMSTYHFHRVFKQVTGLTPKQYAAAQREKRVRNELVRGSAVTNAIFDAGYNNSNSRFYEKSDKVLGMTASSYRAGGPGRNPLRHR